MSETDVLTNVFIGRTRQPTDSELAHELGPVKQLWDKLVSDMAAEYGTTGQEWASYSPKAGWSLRLKKQKRNILYLSPCHGAFRVSLALGDRAVQAARAGKLSKRAVRFIDEAKRYPEGTGVQITVTDAADLPIVKALAEVKLNH